MTKTELESKHLSDLHQLAAAAGVERFRMLTRAELIERLSDGDGGEWRLRARAAVADARRRVAASGPRRRRRSGSRLRREPRRSRARGRAGRRRGRRGGPAPTRAPRARPRRPPRDAEACRAEERRASPTPTRTPTRTARARARAAAAAGAVRFGRRREGITIQDLLLPAESGRQAVLLAESREAATELLRGVAADLAAGSEGPDPVALLIDPSPEELADWKREAPQAELVSAGQARHANDALAAAQRRAADGEDVILLVDSLTRFAESFGDTDAAKELFDAGRGDAAAGKGSLTVVV